MTPEQRSRFAAAAAALNDAIVAVEDHIRSLDWAIDAQVKMSDGVWLRWGMLRPGEGPRCLLLIQHNQRTKLVHANTKMRVEAVAYLDKLMAAFHTVTDEVIDDIEAATTVALAVAAGEYD